MFVCFEIPLPPSEIAKTVEEDIQARKSSGRQLATLSGVENVNHLIKCYSRAMDFGAYQSCGGINKIIVELWMRESED